MSGHSKWSSIKHKKGAADARRGKLFSRLIKELTVAARLGGGDPEGNPRLRNAILTAKAANMPKDNIDRAIKKGTGELGGVSYEESTYEGYGPGGVAILVETLTDNRNRTASEIRTIFSKRGGNLGDAGCVAWMFNRRGLITFPKEALDEDTLMEAALEAGADDVQDGGRQFEVYTEPNDLHRVGEAFEARGLKPEMTNLTMTPQSTVKVTGADAPRLLKLLEHLEDSDDVQHVYANFDIDDELLEALGG